MPSITKRTSKAGAASYLIRVFVEEGPSGKQVTKSMTWKPPAGMRPSAADKQAEKEAVLFEQKVRSGVVSIDGKTTFSEYAARWMDAAEIAPMTREHYKFLFSRINKAIGHIPLEKMRTDHIKTFIKNLREEGVRVSGHFAISKGFEERRKSVGMTQRRLSELTGISVTTIITAARKKRISLVTANKLSTALDSKTESIFAIQASSDKLSDRTVRHHYTLIRTILNAAKKERIITQSVTDYMEAPKLPRTEANYLNDEEARLFLSALLNEPDIRVKTALTLDLFTGMRRGELCGLSWTDIDADNKLIHIRRASQYISGQGIIEVPTKNKSSERSITISEFVLKVIGDYRKWWIEQRLLHGDRWKGEKERLFIQEDGKPIFPDTINGWLKKFIERNNLPHTHPHALRHTFITLQIAAGVDIRTLQARSGHAQASTLLNVYSHAIQSAQERAAQAMDDMLLPRQNKG